MKRKIFKMISVVLTMVLLMSVFVTPVAAGRENDRGWRNVPPPELQYLDAEVRVIGGQPVIIAGTRKGYVNTPVALPVVFSVDGQTIPLQRQGNGVVVPTEDGPVVVPLEDFCVVMVNGQLALKAEVNPAPLFIIGGAIIGAKLGAKFFPALIGVKATPTAKIAGGTAGAFVGAEAGSQIGR